MIAEATGARALAIVARDSGHPGDKVPFRTQQVLISWVFSFASLTLLLDFLALQALMHNGNAYFAALSNWFGVVSCVLWFLGFVLLIHWLHSIGATLGGLVGAYLKLVAAVFFNLQPMTGTANQPGTGGPSGLWWSNLVGIILFHMGNMVSCADFWVNPPPGSKRSAGWLFHGNLPITAMWVYQLATWFLVAGNLIACNWSGDEVTKQWVATGEWTVEMCQVAGALLLLLGSLIFTAWCNGFTNFAHQPLAPESEGTCEA